MQGRGLGRWYEKREFVVSKGRKAEAMLYPHEKMRTPRREKSLSSVWLESEDERASDLRGPFVELTHVSSDGTPVKLFAIAK